MQMHKQITDCHAKLDGIQTYNTWKACKNATAKELLKLKKNLKFVLALKHNKSDIIWNGISNNKFS